MSNERQPEKCAKREMQCIGSFTASSQDGAQHTIEIWTHFDAVHDRERSRVEPGLLFLTTTDGRAVDRVAQGEYHLKDHPEQTLSSRDPNAP
jgi:hypothetical protein